MSNGRTALERARQVIVKVGSHALAEDDGLITSLARDVSAARREGRSVVLVSSGAVALGWKSLGYRERPQEVAKLQASAAMGQGELMSRYSEAFSAEGVPVAQLLLTHSDLSRRLRLNNARSALMELLQAGCVPIINENDTVATEEIRFGDNDQLAAMVTPLLGADLLVLLTNAAGVLDAQGTRIETFGAGARVHEHDSLASGHGSGGIGAKVEAARRACRCGAHTVIAPVGERGVLTRVLAGEDVGTLFEPLGSALRARKHWIAYTLRPRGVVVIDPGAREAIETGRRSLLPIGVLGVRGKFDPGDSVSIVSAEGVELARGLSGISAQEIARVAGVCRDSLNDPGELERACVVVHKDDLVLLE